MAIIAGIDEAGYGPIFGPLVLTAVVFNVPDDGADNCLWRLLESAVTKKARRLNRDAGAGPEGRIIVDDSKKVYTNGGIKRLEEGILAFLWYRKGPVHSFLELLRALSCYDEGVLSGYPWYVGKDISLPVGSARSTITNNVQLLGRVLAEKGIELCGIRSVPVSTSEFNRQIDLTNNKSSVLFNACAALLVAIWKKFGMQGTEVIVDKLGGRNNYRQLLSETFAGCQIKTFKVSAEASTYGIKGYDREMAVSFVQKADALHLPTALASMYSKYVRELFIKLFNAYWQEKVPGLMPTAGYPLDAKRFLQQIYDTKRDLGISDNILIRKR